MIIFFNIEKGKFNDKIIIDFSKIRAIKFLFINFIFFKHTSLKYIFSDLKNIIL